MVLGFTPHAQSSSLDIGKYNSDKFAKRGRVKCRYSFVPASLSISSKDTISTNRICRSLAAFLKPVIVRERFYANLVSAP